MMFSIIHILDKNVYVSYKELMKLLVHIPGQYLCLLFDKSILSLLQENFVDFYSC